MMRTCPECLEDRPETAYNPRYVECFKCRVGSVQFAKGQLVNQLHPGATMNESREIIVREGRANGNDPIPVPQRAELI